MTGTTWFSQPVIATSIGLYASPSRLTCPFAITAIHVIVNAADLVEQSQSKTLSRLVP